MYLFLLYRLGLVVACVIVAIVVFMVTNVTCAVLVHGYQSRSEEPPRAIAITRVSVNDGLFLLLGAMLSVFIYRVNQISMISVVLEAKVGHISNCSIIGFYW